MDELTASKYLKASREETKKCKKTTSTPRPPVNRIPVLKKMSNEIGKYTIPNELLPDPEWSHNLTQWFGYVRFNVNQLKKQNKNEINNDIKLEKQTKNNENENSTSECVNEVNNTEGSTKKKTPFAEIIQLIEKGELPTVDIITNINDASGILFYFKKRHTDFSHSDLCWIFSALTTIDRLMLPEMCECIQIISSIVKKQICEGSGENNKLYPYLSVINDLRVKYFNQF